MYSLAGKQTKQAVSRIDPSRFGWDSLASAAFNHFKRALQQQVTLAHKDASQLLCVYMDASDLIWSGVITQVSFSDVGKDHINLRHQPLFFLSGHCSGPQLGWSTLENEAYAIMASVERMHWLLATSDGFDLFIDHYSLIFLFDPLAVVLDLS